MTRRDYVLAVLAASNGAALTPVQVQKLFFLLDRKAPHLTGGPHFQFEAFDYGPFDKGIYSELRTLATMGYAEIESPPNTPVRRYRATEAGVRHGRQVLDGLPAGAAGYNRDLSAWVRGQSFASLVSAIYNEYPDMKANSVFRY
ncbi:MAG: hypothetical protein K2X87_02440 [Gemmataceae bacterium]|nr:hypothetical protein [Gemmataceae bacterium]